METSPTATATPPTDRPLGPDSVRPADPTPAPPAGDLLTTDQMTRQLRADLARVEAAGAAHAAQEARREFNERRADLGGPNGSGRDAIVAALTQAQRPEMEAAVQAADGAARAADANARQILSQLGGDRRSLPPSARAAAAELAPLVEADAGRLSLPRLATELRHAVATGDQAAMWCWARAIGPRLAARPAGVEHPTDEAARAELGRLTSQVKDALRDTSFDGIRQEADRVLERAGAVRAKADRGKRALAGPVKTVDGRTKVAWPSS